MGRYILRNRFGAVFLLVALVFLLSCAEKRTELTFMVGGAPNEVEYWERLMNEFEKRSGLDVRIIRQPTDSDQRRQGLVVALESRQGDPDVFLMDVVWIGQFAASGWLEPIGPLAEKTKFPTQPFFRRIIDHADLYQDTLFALPIYVDGGLLYYRKDLLAKYGYDAPPETWEELLEYSLEVQKGERLENPHFYGFVWQGAQYEGLVCTFLEFAASNDGAIAKDDRKIQLNTVQNTEALTFMRQLIHAYQVSPPNTFTEMKEEEVRNFFQRGNALFERNWPYAWKLHENEVSPVRGKVGIAPLPHFLGGESVSALGGWHVGISRYSDAKEQAWDLVKFITSYETEKKLMLNLGWNPGRRDLYHDNEVMEKFPHLPILKMIFENSVSRPALPHYARLSEAIQRYLNGCLSGQMDAQDALDHAQQEIEKIEKTYNEI